MRLLPIVVRFLGVQELRNRQSSLIGSRSLKSSTRKNPYRNEQVPQSGSRRWEQDRSYWDRYTVSDLFALAETRKQSAFFEINFLNFRSSISTCMPWLNPSSINYISALFTAITREMRILTAKCVFIVMSFDCKIKTYREGYDAIRGKDTKNDYIKTS